MDKHELAATMDRLTRKAKAQINGMRSTGLASAEFNGHTLTANAQRDMYGLRERTAVRWYVDGNLTPRAKVAAAVEEVRA